MPPHCRPAADRSGLGSGRAYLPAGLAGGILSLTAYGLVRWAQTRGALAPIAALRESSVIIGAVIGAVLFGSGSDAGASSRPFSSPAASSSSPCEPTASTGRAGAAAQAVVPVPQALVLCFQVKDDGDAGDVESVVEQFADPP